LLAKAKKAGDAANKFNKSVSKTGRLAARDVNMLGQQFADLGIQLSYGASPFNAIIAQGSQIQYLLGNQGVNTIGGSLRILGQGLIGFLNPLNLAIVGLGAAAAGAVSLWSALSDSGIRRCPQAFKRIHRKDTGEL
jgi:hypothetical protein